MQGFILFVKFNRYFCFRKSKKSKKKKENLVTFVYDSYCSRDSINIFQSDDGYRFISS